MDLNGFLVSPFASYCLTLIHGCNESCLLDDMYSAYSHQQGQARNSGKDRVWIKYQLQGPPHSIETQMTLLQSLHLKMEKTAAI